MSDTLIPTNQMTKVFKKKIELLGELLSSKVDDDDLELEIEASHAPRLNSHGSLTKIPRMQSRKGSLSGSSFSDSPPKGSPKKGGLFSLWSSGSEDGKSFLSSVVPDLDIVPNSKVGDEFGYNMDACPLPGEEVLLITKIRLLVHGEKPMPMELGTIPEYKLKPNDKYCVEFQFVVKDDIGPDCVLHEKISTVTRSEIHKFGMGTLDKRDEKYVFRLPKREARAGKFSKTEVQVRFLDKDQNVLNGYTFVYDVDTMIMDIKGIDPIQDMML